MPKQLKISYEKCTGCKSCEVACSLFNEGHMNPSKSRISVIIFIEGKYTLPFNFVSTCKQCADAPCLKNCPVNAISRLKDKTKRVVIDKDKCIGCGKCGKVCPFGAMLFNIENNKAFKCELCDGNPVCALICPTGAIKYVNRKSFYAQYVDCQMQGWSIIYKINRDIFKNAKKKQS